MFVKLVNSEDPAKLYFVSYDQTQNFSSFRDPSKIQIKIFYPLFCVDVKVSISLEANDINWVSETKIMERLIPNKDE
jgi:hypothetical protein